MDLIADLYAPVRAYLFLFGTGGPLAMQGGRRSFVIVVIDVK
jgi:hypothetical protein